MTNTQGGLLSEFLYWREVNAKPPPNSSSKAYILEKITNSARPRSYLIQTDSRQIRRSRAKEKLAPPSIALAPCRRAEITPSHA